MPYKTKTIRVRKKMKGGYILDFVEWTKANNIRLKYFRPKKKRGRK